MADYFFDTSALVKRHVIEAGSPWIKSLVRAKAAHTLYIARITAVEVTSAITRRQHAGDLSAAQAGAILGHFRRHLTQYYRIIELSPTLFAQWTQGRCRARLWEVLLQVIASYEVDDRPNRVEPRAIKRRPKPRKLLNEPREEARNRLLKRKYEQPILNAA